MQDTQHVEQLGLPEQLYLLLTDPMTGEPRFPKERVRQVLGMSIVWELMHLGVLALSSNYIMWVDPAEITLDHLSKFSRYMASRVPIGGQQLAHEIGEHFQPIWQVIGKAMVQEHLLKPAVQDRWLFFHHQVLMQLAEARHDNMALSRLMRDVARNLWDPQYDDELAHTHPRLLARIVILENYGLLSSVIGAEAYGLTKHHLPALRAYLHSAKPAEPVVADADPPLGFAHRWTDNRSSVFDDDCTFWIDDGVHG